MKLDISGYTEQEVLRLMLIGLNSHLAAINAKIAEIETELGQVKSGHLKSLKAAKPQLAKPATGTRPHMSPAGRQHIADAQKKRWAAVRRAKVVAEREKAAKRAARPKKARNSNLEMGLAEEQLSA